MTSFTRKQTSRQCHQQKRLPFTRKVSFEMSIYTSRAAIRNLERIARHKAALRLAIQAKDTAAINALLAELGTLTTAR
jgi:hypothetical protein